MSNFKMVAGEASGNFSTLENEVVFVIEGTANLLLDFAVLRKEYLDPIIENFNGGPLQDSSCFFGDEYGPNQYCLIVFGTKSCDDAVQIVHYTRNVHELVKAIDDISFTGGGVLEGSLLVEGLGFALQAFDDMENQRQSAKVQRNCIVVSNSVPYPQLTKECLNYQNKSMDQLAELLSKGNINLSVISPRKLPALKSIFEKSIRGDCKTLKDCSKDPHHLVCIQGLVLPGTQGTLTMASPQSKAQTMTKNDLNTTPPQAVTTTNKGSPGNTGSPSMKRPTIAEQQPQEVPPKKTHKLPASPQAGSIQNNNPYITSSANQVMHGPQTFLHNPMIYNPLATSNTIVAPPNQQVIPTSISASDSIGQQSHPGIPHPAEAMNVGHQNQAWNGTLEWTESVKNDAMQQIPQKVTRSLQCHISVVAPGNSIKTDKWPPKLIMQLIPQHLLSTLGPLLQNCKTVAFRFPTTDPESLKALYRVMALNGVKFAGCVHFAPNPGCDIKVLLLIYSPKKKAFVGLIPHDQGNFVSGIRTVLHNYRISQEKYKKQLAHQRNLIAAQMRQQQQMQQSQQQAFPNQQFNQQNAALQQNQLALTGNPQVDPATLLAQNTMISQTSQPLDVSITPSTQTSTIQINAGSVGNPIGTMAPTMPGLDQEALRLQAIKQQAQQQRQQLLIRQKIQQLQQQHQVQQAQQQQQQQFVQQQQQQLQQNQPVQNQLHHLLQQVQNQAASQSAGQQQTMTPQQWQQQQRALLLQHQRQQQQQQQQQTQQQQQQQMANQMAQVQMSSAQLAQSQTQMAPGQVSQAQMTVQNLAQAGQQDFFPEKMSLLDLLQP